MLISLLHLIATQSLEGEGRVRMNLIADESQSEREILKFNQVRIRMAISMNSGPVTVPKRDL